MTIPTTPDTGHDKSKRILFACTQNAVRSVIAAALLEQHNHPQIAAIHSCGVIAGAADGFTMAVLAESGIDITDHEPADFSHFNPDEFDVIYTFSQDAYGFVQEWADPQTPCHYCDVKPPLHSEHSREETMVSYRKLCDEVAACVEEIIASIS